jgi:hypothetical protein
MDLEKLEKLAKLVLAEMPASSASSYPFSIYPQLEMKFRNLMAIASETLPEHQVFFNIALKRVDGSDDAKLAIRHLLEIMKLEKESNSLIKEMKIFQSAEEKMKEVGFSFQKEDYVSTFNNLNTALEIIIKNKVGIPTTIAKVNTANIIEVLVKYRVEPHLYFDEVRKRVIDIDNKVKHQGYCPSKIESINGIKAMDELIAKLRNMDMKLTDEIKNKIYEGL